MDISVVGSKLGTVLIGGSGVFNRVLTVESKMPPFLISAFPLNFLAFTLLLLS